jgi:hypothetical protein
MGGTDDISNIIELSVAEHADAHQKLFEEHGHWQDYLAWQGLAGLIPKEELVRLIQSEAGKARILKHGNPFSGIRTWGNFAINKEFLRKRKQWPKDFINRVIKIHNLVQNGTLKNMQ